jgi:hypothetical protein
VIVNQGKRAPSGFCEEHCHSSYYLCPDKLKDIAGKPRTVLAPTEAELVLNSSITVEEQTPYLRITAPPVRVKEKHGSSKRKRKEANVKAMSRGRTKTASYACAGTSTATRKAARQMCAKCRKAGRQLDSTDWHKAKTCPYDIVDVDALEFKIPPTTARLRAKPKTSYTSGKPVREKKLRILSVKGDDMQFVME